MEGDRCGYIRSRPRDRARKRHVSGADSVEFLEGEWFAPLNSRRFHLIASNPPYVSEGDDALKDATLQHEPQIALAAGLDGLSAIREIVLAAPDYLERHGWLLLEHGSDQAAAVAHELVGRGFGHVRSHRDLAGHWRLTEAQWTGSPKKDTLK